MQGMLFYQNEVGNKEEIDLKTQLSPILHFVLLNSHFIRTLNKFYSYCWNMNSYVQEQWHAFNILEL